MDEGDVQYLAWGERESTGLILIHGGGAHAHWWDFVAPFFAEFFRVVAVDLPGNGDSAFRAEYTSKGLAAAVLAAAADAGCAGPLVVAGHSFGGHVALATALEASGGVGHLVLVDSPIRSATDPRRFDPRNTAIRPKRVYADIDHAVRNFRLLPAQPCRNRFLMDYIARHSLRRNDRGWVWKFDPHFFPHLDVEDLTPRVPELTCLTALVYGEQSLLMDPPTLAMMKDLFGEHVPVRMLADAHHHVMLDQPLEFIAALETLFGAWGILPTRSEG
jgi:pimeloyl-ACP methyl ester carboxylesterase